MSEAAGVIHVVETGAKADQRKWAREMEIGEVAVIDDVDALKWHKGHVIMRTYNSFVSLNNPRVTWSDRTLPYRVRSVKDLIAIKLWK